MKKDFKSYMSRGNRANNASMQNSEVNGVNFDNKSFNLVNNNLSAELMEKYNGGNSINGQGYNGGNGVNGQGYNGGNSVNGQGYNGGNGVNGQGYNGGNSVNGQGYNGDNGVNGQGYNGGNSINGQGYNGGNSINGQGYNGGNFNMLEKNENQINVNKKIYNENFDKNFTGNKITEKNYKTYSGFGVFENDEKNSNSADNIDTGKQIKNIESDNYNKVKKQDTQKLSNNTNSNTNNYNGMQNNNKNSLGNNNINTLDSKQITANSFNGNTQKNYQNFNFDNSMDMLDSKKNTANILNNNSQILNNPQYQQAINTYGNMNENQLLQELEKQISQQKTEGKFNPNEMEGYYNQMLPMLNAEQQNKLKSIMAKMKN